MAHFDHFLDLIAPWTWLAHRAHVFAVILLGDRFNPIVGQIVFILVLPAILVLRVILGLKRCLGLSHPVPVLRYGIRLWRSLWGRLWGRLWGGLYCILALRGFG